MFAYLIVQYFEFPNTPNWPNYIKTIIINSCIPPLTISLEFELLADPAIFVAWQAQSASSASTILLIVKNGLVGEFWIEYLLSWVICVDEPPVIGVFVHDHDEAVVPVI